MPVALSGSWIDTGIRAWAVIGGEGNIVMNSMTEVCPGINAIFSNVPQIQFGELFGPSWVLFGHSFRFGSCPAYGVPGFVWTHQAWLKNPRDTFNPWTHPDWAGTTLLEQYGHNAVATKDRVKQSQWYRFQDITGPFRLGVQYRLLGATTDVPLFSDRHYTQEYSWFADGYTSKRAEFAGHSTGTLWFGGIVSSSLWNWNEAQNDAVIPHNAGLDLGRLRWTTFLNQSSFDPGRVDAQFRGLYTSNDPDGGSLLVDTSDLSGPLMHGLAAGAVNCIWQNGFNVQQETATPAHRVRYNLSVNRFGAGDALAEVLDSYVTNVSLHSDGSQRTPQADFLRTPYYQEFETHLTSWERRTKDLPASYEFNLRPSWAAEQDPAHPADNLWLPIRAVPTRHDPGGELEAGQYVSTPYYPATVELADRLDVQRPDGIRPSDWVSNDGDLVVTEGATETTFQVSGSLPGSARARRNLVGATTWRDRINPLHPDFSITAYEVAKHNVHVPAGEDVWWWGTYRKLRVRATVPEPCVLTLQVIGVHLEVFDPHTTGSDRVDNYTATEHAYTASYALELEEGSNTVDVDLLFPGEGGPFYLSRVDALEWSGFPPGTTVLQEMAFVATSGRLKLAFHKTNTKSAYQAAIDAEQDPPPESLDYSALWGNVQGSAPFAHWGDQRDKPDEVGTYGGGIRYVEPLTGMPSGTIQDAQMSITSFLGRLGQIEGWTVRMDDLAREEALEDEYGRSLASSEQADWLKPQVPFVTVVSGEPGHVHLPAHPVCRRLSITNLVAYVIHVEHPINAALEAVATVEGANEPAPPGISIAAVRTDTGAIVATADTEDGGYVCVYPIPGNGVVPFELQEQQ